MKKPAVAGFSFGGDKGTRTPDLFDANEALSQLSYIPKARGVYSPWPGTVKRERPNVLSEKLQDLWAACSLASWSRTITEFDRPD